MGNFSMRSISKGVKITFSYLWTIDIPYFFSLLDSYFENIDEFATDYSVFGPLLTL